MHIEPTHLPKMHLHLKKGALHRTLGVKQGKKLTSSQISKARHSKNPLTRKRAVFAANARKWHRG